MKHIHVILLAVTIVFLHGCYSEPVANFTFQFGDDNSAPAEVIFLNTSIEADNYRWDFDDGTTSTEKEPVHTFNQAGTYSVTMWAKGRGGESFITKDVTVVQNTTYIIRNNSTVTLYEVISYYHNGVEIESYYPHGTMFGNTYSEEVITEKSPLDIKFELVDGSEWKIRGSYYITFGTLNYLDIYDDTDIDPYDPAKKSGSSSGSAHSPDDNLRNRESGKVIRLKDLVQ